MWDTRRTVTLECKECRKPYEVAGLDVDNPHLLEQDERKGIAHLCPSCSRRVSIRRERVLIRRDAHRWPICPRETTPEEKFWELARRTFPQVKIINQFEALGYRLDFYFPDHEICVEVDGYDYHQTRELEDSERDTKLFEYGIETVRFSNEEVLDDPQFVIKRLDEVLRSNVSALISPYPNR